MSQFYCCHDWHPFPTHSYHYQHYVVGCLRSVICCHTGGGSNQCWLAALCAPSALHLLLITPFLFIQAYALFQCRYVFCGLSYLVCWDLLSAICVLCPGSPGEELVNPLDRLSGLGARDGTPVHLLLSVNPPSWCGRGEPVFPPSSLFGFWMLTS